MNIQSYRDVLEALRAYVTHGEPDGPKVRKRLRILGTAAELFEQHGYRRTPISEVARQAAVAKGTVYLYYPSKAHLLLHVIMHERLTLYERKGRALAGDSRILRQQGP